MGGAVPDDIKLAMCFGNREMLASTIPQSLMTDHEGLSRM